MKNKSKLEEKTASSEYHSNYLEKEKKLNLYAKIGLGVFIVAPIIGGILGYIYKDPNISTLANLSHGSLVGFAFDLVGLPLAAIAAAEALRDLDGPF